MRNEGFNVLVVKCIENKREEFQFNASAMNVSELLFIKKLRELAKAFIESSGKAFQFRDGEIVPTAVGKCFIRLVDKGCLSFDKAYTLEPYLALVIEEIDWPEVSHLLSCVKAGTGSLQTLDALNWLADSIREKASAPEFRRGLNSYHRSANKNFKELLKYERALFDCYSRMLVLRIDLSYRKEFCMVEQEVALRHRKRLFDNARSNKLFRHMLGYVTKLEYGAEKGFHFHCIFFFDGSMVREDITLAKRIGEYWASVISDGMGGYYNCNHAKETYRRCGIGMVTYSDVDKREGLRSAMMYLTKTDIYMKLKAKGRTFTKGVMPSSPSGRGRPRASITLNEG